MKKATKPAGRFNALLPYLFKSYEQGKCFVSFFSEWVVYKWTENSGQLRQLRWYQFNGTTCSSIGTSGLI